METSWYGLFDLGPDETLSVRAGDMQEFMRQYMMGVTNPGLTVTTPEEQKEQDAAREQQRPETFCTIRWMRDDIVDAIARASGIRLDRSGPRAEEVEGVIDLVAGEVGKQLRDGSIEEGWSIIDTLMPDYAIERAMEIAPEQVPEPGKQSVRDWYLLNYGTDELGADIDPEATFDDALRAVSLGSGFYDAIGVGDSIVRERIFSELADRYGVGYDDIYEAWLHERPVEGVTLGTDEPDMSLKSMAQDARSAASELEQQGTRDAVARDEQVHE